MRRWTLILIAVIIILIILIVLLNNFSATPDGSNYSQMEVQMRKLWY